MPQLVRLLVRLLRDRAISSRIFFQVLITLDIPA